MKSKDIIKVENLNTDNSFKIRWSLTYLCNYACDFCIQGNKLKHIEKSQEESQENRNIICNNLINFIEQELNNKYNCIDLYLIGGEVTILNDFIDIINKVINCKFKGKIRVKITTNLSTNEEKLNKLIKLFNENTNYLRELHINASYYKEFANEEEFINKIKLLSNNNKIKKLHFLNVIYKYMKKILRKKRNNKTLNTIKNKFERIYVSIGYPITNDSDYYNYLKFKKKYKKVTNNIHFIIIKRYKTCISDKLKKKIIKEEKLVKAIKVTFKNGEVFYCSNNNKIALKLDNEDTFNSKGYLCDVGLHNISISSTGMVSRCSSCKEKTQVGSLLKNNFKLPNTKLICPVTSCNCNYYSIIEKKQKNS